MRVDAYSTGTGVRAAADEPYWGLSAIEPRFPFDLATPPESNRWPVFGARLDWIDEIPITSSRCALCAHRGRQAAYRPARELRHFFLNGRRFAVVVCPTCSLQRLDPQPHPWMLDQLYGAHYHAATPAHPLYEQGCHTALEDAGRESEKARLNLATLRKYVTPRGVTSGYGAMRTRRAVVEVGFGSGALLQALNDAGYFGVGLEKNAALAASAAARNLPVRFADFLTDWTMKAHAIVMMSVLEHVLAPVAYLRKARDLLAPGGVLMLRLPDTPDSGPTLALVEHLWHFNQATITQLLEATGFRVLEIGGFGAWRGEKYPGSVVSMTIVARPTKES